jgi:hypothetical protein
MGKELIEELMNYVYFRLSYLMDKWLEDTKAYKEAITLYKKLKNLLKNE